MPTVYGVALFQNIRQFQFNTSWCPIIQDPHADTAEVTDALYYNADAYDDFAMMLMLMLLLPMPRV